MVICVVDYYAAIQNDITEKCWGPWASGPKYKVEKGYQRVVGKWIGGDRWGKSFLIISSNKNK